MKLNIAAMSATVGLLWGGAVLAIEIVNLVRPTYGRRFLRTIGSIYPGYKATRSAKDIATGAAYAVADGAIGGALLAALYNKIQSSGGKRMKFLRAA